MKIKQKLMPIVEQQLNFMFKKNLDTQRVRNYCSIISDIVTIGKIKPSEQNHTTPIVYNRSGTYSYSTFIKKDQSLGDVSIKDHMTKKKTAITPTREQNYSEWYQQVISVAELAENSAVRGCMVIKPWGYGIWEKIQSILDKQLKATGCSNAYFPLLIPLSYLEKEAQHVEGFAKECAVVTHHRLEVNEQGKLIPASPLAEPLIIRPTSETIIGETFSKWIKSHRDLPLLINQWANVMRWEMRPRLFLRTSEFLWQEGHTVHQNSEEAVTQTLKILDLYENFLKNTLAIHVVKGRKTISERFPGAIDTYTIEAMMQDKKALQVGTSHFLGQNFSKSHKIQFTDANQKTNFGWTTSWGVSTRLIGGLIMSHSDDNGLILPPKISPYQIVIIPIFVNDKTISYCTKLQKEISAKTFSNSNITVHIDLKDIRSGEKFWYWVTKGIPLIVQIGDRELSSNIIKYIDRTSDLNGEFLSYEEFVSSSSKLLTTIQDTLLIRSQNLFNNNICTLHNLKDFKAYFESKNPGFVTCFAIDSPKIEECIKPIGVSTRCILDDNKDDMGSCIFTGEKTSKKIIFAKAY